jgi:hypothetical protein
MVTNLSLHRTYLGRLLDQEVGSAYLALDERELVSHIESLSVEVVSKRR